MRDLPKILFVAATESDAFSIISQLENPRFYKQRTGMIHGGLWRDASVRVLLAGHEGEPTAAALREALEMDRPVAVVNMGLATALTADLQIGDMIVAQKFEVVPPAGAVTTRPLAGKLFDMVRTFVKLNPSLGSRLGSLAAVPEVPHEPEMKMALFERSRADLADATGLAVATVAEEWQLPFVVLRSVFEVSHERLPELEAMVRDKGKLSTTRLLGRFAIRPTEIFSLRDLSGRARMCRDRMDLFADSFCRTVRTVRESAPEEPPPAPVAAPVAAPKPISLPRPSSAPAAQPQPQKTSTGWLDPPQR
ncbi:MAG: hypothetical protein IT462_10425 [Planctomycetes bacterium]|nr:hypothetical protein [Planctomycetota bacterium]